MFQPNSPSRQQYANQQHGSKQHHDGSSSQQPQQKQQQQQPLGFSERIKQQQRSPNRRQVPPPINTQPGPPIMRQGRFLSPTNSVGQGGITPTPPGNSSSGGGGSGSGRGRGAFFSGRSPQHQRRYGGARRPPSSQHNYGTNKPLSPTTSQQSTVRFDEETTHQQPQEELRDQAHSPTFLFEEEEWMESDDDRDDDHNDDRDQDCDAQEGIGHNNNGPTGRDSNNKPPFIPSEAQLALLCLDYLRDLRRSYQHKEDLLNAEGLDADYLALAAWSLSRAFVRPKKLKHGNVKVSTVAELSSRGKRVVETNFYGGGGLGGGLLEDEPFGNDAWYRQLEDDVVIDVDDDDEHADLRNVFDLSENISLPTLKDITNEVLLCHPNEQPFSKKFHDTNNNDDNDDDDDDDEPYYEHNDGHFSNAHRFYLLNGLASDTSSDQIDGLMNPKGLSPRSNAPSVNASISSGGPLSFAEICSAGLHALRGRSRIRAEQEMVDDPLFRQFVQAVSAGGFFQEKRGDDRRIKSSSSRSSSPSKLSSYSQQQQQQQRKASGELTPEEEERRSRLLYEEKYRKIVSKFRTKLANKEAQLLQQQIQSQQQSSSWMSYHYKHPPTTSPSRIRSAYGIMSSSGGNASVSSAVSDSGPGGTTAIMMICSDVADRQRRRRERRMERARSERTITSGHPTSELEQKVADLTLPRMDDRAVVPQDDEYESLRAMSLQSSTREEEQTSQLGGRASPTKKLQPPIETSASSPSSKQQTLRAQLVPKMTKSIRQQKELPKHVLSKRQISPSKSRAKKPSQTSSSPSKSKSDPPASSSSSATNDDAHDGDPQSRHQEAEQLGAEANSLMQKKQFHLALDKYTAAIELTPTGPNTHVYHSNRSAAHLSLNDAESSIEDNERSLALHPNYAKAHSRLGLARFAMGEYEKAVRAYERALEIDPENEWSRDHLERAKEKLTVSGGGGGSLGDLMLEENDEEKEEDVAVKENSVKKVKPAILTEAIADDDEDTWLTPFDEKTIHEETDEAAEEEEETVDYAEEEEENAEETEEDIDIIAEQTRRADDHKDKGNEHMSKKEYELALHQYNEAVHVSPAGPNSHVYYSNRAAAHCYLARYESASDDCRTSIALRPTYEKAHARLGLSLFFRGKYEEAIGAYERSLELDPMNKASASYLKKAEARLKEIQRKEEEEEGIRKKEEEEKERLKRRKEMVERQRQQQKTRYHQQRQRIHVPEVDGIPEEEEGSANDNSGVTSTSLASIVTNENEEKPKEEAVVEDDPSIAMLSSTSQDQYYQEAFGPFATSFDPFSTSDDEC